MSVSKDNLIITSKKEKKLIGKEGIVMRFIMLIFNIIFFFILTDSIARYFNYRDDNLYFLFIIFSCYVLSGIFSYFISYAICRLLSEFSGYKISSLSVLIEEKRTHRRLWIYIFSILFQSLAYMISLVSIIEKTIGLPYFVLAPLVWVIIYITSRILAIILYKLFNSI